MSLAILSQAYEDTRRLAIAGSGLARDDFRLKRLVPQLEKAGEKAPVLARVADAARGLAESDAKSAPARLLELSTLLTAIRYTQGHTGAEGELQPIETSGLDLPSTVASARVLEPLIAALTTTGSGRLEVIKDAHRRGAFRDLRLVQPAIAALDDVYPEIADFVATRVLPGLGRGVVPLLVHAFDPQGKAGDVRRLLAIHRIDPEASRQLAESALASGSKEMKIAAIACLDGSTEHLDTLLEQTRARSKDVRRAACAALTRLPNDAVSDALLEALSSADADLAIESARRSRSSRLLRFLVEHSSHEVEKLLQSRDALLVAAVMTRSEASEVRGALVGVRDALPAEAFAMAFLAALRTLEPTEVHDAFSAALGTTGWFGRRKPPADPAKKDALLWVLHETGHRDLARELGVGKSVAPTRPVDLIPRPSTVPTPTGARSRAP